MKTATEIANHPKAQLHREIVARLRDSGSIYGAERMWGRLRLNARFWKRLSTYGLASADRQSQLNKVAFPDCNFAGVDAALAAGNNLRGLYDLACGRSWLAMDSHGNYKQGGKGLKIIRELSPARPRYSLGAARASPRRNSPGKRTATTDGEKGDVDRGYVKR